MGAFVELEVTPKKKENEGRRKLVEATKKEVGRAVWGKNFKKGSTMQRLKRKYIFSLFFAIHENLSLFAQTSFTSSAFHGQTDI